MDRVYVRLQSIDDVKKFIKLISGIEGSVELTTGHYIVNAKSLAGVLCLDLSRKLEVIFERKTLENILVIEKYLDSY